MSKKPDFEVKKQGYDKSSVNRYIENLSRELEFNEAKLDVYKKQLDFLTQQLEVKQDQCLKLVNELKLLQSSTERMILPEEVSGYINSDDSVKARNTADQIILESLMISKEILDNLAETALNTKEYKNELLDKLESITNSVIDIDIIEPLVIDWINERD